MVWGMPILRAMLYILPDVPGATFIPGATSIPESRIYIFRFVLTRNRLGVNTLFRYLTGNLVSSNWVFDSSFTKSKKGSYKGQGN